MRKFKSILFNTCLTALLITSAVNSTEAMDVVRKNYKERMEVYNYSPTDIRIPGYTDTLNKLFAREPNKAPVAREKLKGIQEEVLKAVMGTALIHGDAMSVEIPTSNTLRTLAPDVRAHFEILGYAQSLTQKYTKFFGVRADNRDGAAEKASALKGIKSDSDDLEERSGITRIEFAEWFRDVCTSHDKGLSTQNEDYWRDQKSSKVLDSKQDESRKRVEPPSSSKESQAAAWLQKDNFHKNIESWDNTGDSVEQITKHQHELGLTGDALRRLVGVGKEIINAALENHVKSGRLDRLLDEERLKTLKENDLTYGQRLMAKVAEVNSNFNKLEMIANILSGASKDRYYRKHGSIVEYREILLNIGRQIQEILQPSEYGSYLLGEIANNLSHDDDALRRKFNVSFTTVSKKEWGGKNAAEMFDENIFNLSFPVRRGKNPKMQEVLGIMWRELPSECRESGR